MERTVLEERDALSMERLASITKEHTAQEPFGDYFRKTASFVIKMDEVYRKIKDGKITVFSLTESLWLLKTSRESCKVGSI